MAQALLFQAAFDELGVDQLTNQGGGDHLDARAGNLLFHLGGDFLGGDVVKLGLPDQGLLYARPVPGVHLLGAGAHKQGHISGFGAEDGILFAAFHYLELGHLFSPAVRGHCYLADRPELGFAEGDARCYPGHILRLHIVHWVRLRGSFGGCQFFHLLASPSPSQNQRLPKAAAHPLCCTVLILTHKMWWRQPPIWFFVKTLVTTTDKYVTPCHYLKHGDYHYSCPSYVYVKLVPGGANGL